MYKEIKTCRICGNKNLIPVLDLGKLYLTGVFPKSKEEKITSGPLELVKCQEDGEGKTCGLLQLKQTYDLNEMYGQNYGYRSGLNKSMITHLQNIVKRIMNIVSILPGDLVIDIGSNDGTLLNAYPNKEAILVGVDPTGEKFKRYYSKHIYLIPDFFSKELIKDNFGRKKVKVVTSIAMFYDLEEPLEFMRQVYNILDEEGIWVCEQSYMPFMLEHNAYDTICHEHLEYYCLKQIKWMADEIGFKIIDIEFNNVNGGSFCITFAKETSSFKENFKLIEKVLEEEKNRRLNTLIPYEEFKHRVHKHREKLLQLIYKIRAENKKIFGYGASTKGNVILQFCDLTERDIPFIAEINEDKFGCYTPGTYIPIISEEEAKAMKPDYFFVLPWHFREEFLKREREYLEGGGKFIFPLPEVEII